MTVLTVDNVSKSYGQVSAVADATMIVGRGEVVALLGPNGAGKTTLIRCITGYHRPDRGSVRISGHDPAEDPVRARNQIGYVPERMPLYPELTAREHLSLVMESAAGDHGEARLLEIAAQMLVDDQLDRPVSQLSKGYRQRVGIAMALVRRPSLIVLDEPMNGLDPNQIVSARETFRSAARESGVLLSTHTLAEAAELCDRAVILNHGRVVASLDRSEIRSSLTTLIVAGGVNDDSLADLAKLGRIERHEQKGSTTEIQIRSTGTGSVEYFDWAVRRGLRLEALMPASDGLRELFASLTRELEEE